MNLAEIIEYINRNVTSPSQLEGMRGMGLSIEPLPESYKAKKQTTDSRIDYYICNRNAETRSKLLDKIRANLRENNIDTKENERPIQSDNVVNAIVEEGASNKLDLVAENALLTLCPDTECTHRREYYKSSNFEGTHFTRALYNNRLYWISTGDFSEEKGVWYSKEDGTDATIFLTKDQVSTWDWNYIVVNYYGVFLYRLEYANEQERVKHDSQIRWYGFDGVLKKELTIVDSNHCLSDIYMYGSKIFFSAYTGKVRRNYCVGYYDILTEQKNKFDTPKKEITKVLGNSECLMFQFEDENTEGMWFIYPYKTGEQGKCYSQIEYFDLKNNRVWVNDNKLVDVFCSDKGNVQATSLIEYELQGCKIVPFATPRHWLYRKVFGRVQMEYFDGMRFYRVPEYYNFYSYNKSGEEYQWNAKSLHGQYDKSVILGEYIYMQEGLDWIDQYKATHIQEPSTRRL